MNFYHEVYAAVRRIPKGRVATYGQIASLISTPRASRAVGYALRALPEGNDIPWWRVVNSKGVISIENMEHPAEEQAHLLASDGVLVEKKENTYQVKLAVYLWDARKD